MKQIILNVEGMSCMHCVVSVKGAVSELPAVESVDVDLTSGTVTVHVDTTVTSVAAIKEAIEDIGYDVK